MTQLGLDETVRIWLATVVNSFPARSDLADVTTDVVAGPRSPWMLREAYAPGKDELTVGNLWVWTERTTWNPIGGLGDVYSTDIWRNLSDPAIWNDPFTGIPEPFRADFQVQTAGPDGTLDVPPDAVTWDADGDRWQEVGAGVTAVSKVTFDYSRYLGANWHHGQPITLADAMYGIAQAFDLAYDPDRSRIEVALAVTSRPYLETIKGYRITDDDRLEVYADFWHFDPAYIASYASPTSFSMPWEVLAAMDDLVFEQRRAAYSDTAAARYGVPWLSLAIRRDAGLVDRTLRQFEGDGTVPEGVFGVGDRSLVTPQEAQARYAAAQDWYDERDHLVISDGPFFLAQYDPGKQFAELDAFRDPTYPFKPGDRYMGQPPTLTIGDVESQVVAIGEPVELPVTVEGPGTVALRYLLLDPAQGSVVTQGEATPGDGGTFSVSIGGDVTGALFPGPYQLYLAASSDGIARVTERRVDVEVTP
jgi:peptide/nickel transport system substrate-binding protein